MEDSKKKAMYLIVLFGLVSLFADMAYEGARSVNGPYLKTLGANAAVVGLVAGLGEFAGYAVRLLSGLLADKKRAYWLFTFIGYGMLLSVPLLSLTGMWEVAAVLIVLERLGKAVRSPAKDTLLSSAAKRVGTGFGFGLHEAMDQIGAIAGPLVFSAVFFASTAKNGANSLRDYQFSYALLFIPVIITMIILVLARIRVPSPESLEAEPPKHLQSDTLPRVFWLYTVFTFFIVAGFANFSLMAYHFKAKEILPDAQIPLFYAIAMGVDAFVALFIGKIYDKIKLNALISIPILTLPIPFLVFSNSYAAAVVGIVLWGAVMGIHETIVKAAIADITPLKKRGTGYGIFNTANGLAMFAGSALVGLLYDASLLGAIIVIVALEAVSVPFFFIIRSEVKKHA